MGDQPERREYEHRVRVRAADGNGLAVAGFTLAVCAVALFFVPVLAQILWVLGLVFSGAGLSRARGGRRHGGLAKAGLIISLVGAGVLILVLARLVASV